MPQFDVELNISPETLQRIDNNVGVSKDEAVAIEGSWLPVGFNDKAKIGLRRDKKDRHSHYLGGWSIEGRVLLLYKL